MRSSKLRLHIVGQVKIINGKHCCRKSMWVMAELFGKSGDLQESRKIRKVRCIMEKSSKAEAAHREPEELEACRRKKL